ncbi:MAG: GNAT family N-acetyltransferase, partial [Clostridium sp.]
MDVVFRKAKKGDEAEILDLIDKVLLSYGLKLNIEIEDLDVTDITKYYHNNNGDFEVVLYNNVIIGSYGIYKINETTCELRKMYLKEEFQGSGLGNRMLENSLLIAKELGYKTIT